MHQLKQMDQLGYADNFFSLINDRNMVVENMYGKFQCKLFKSNGDDTGNFCGTRPDFIAKKHQFKKSGRRLLHALTHANDGKRSIYDPK